MRTLNFGIEIETIGQTRAIVAKAIQSVTGGTVHYIGSPSCYDPYKIIDSKGRTWQVVADSSLSAVKSRQAEIVSPILTYKDIPELQNIIRAVRKAGSRTDNSTGIHIHVDSSRFDTKSVVNLVKIVNKQEVYIYKALRVPEYRKNHFAKPIDQSFLTKIENKRPKNMSELNSAWYGHHNSNPYHYHSSRYAALNLHNIFYRGTIEWRI